MERAVPLWGFHPKLGEITQSQTWLPAHFDSIQPQRPACGGKDPKPGMLRGPRPSGSNKKGGSPPERRT